MARLLHFSYIDYEAGPIPDSLANRVVKNRSANKTVVCLVGIYALLWVCLLPIGASAQSTAPFRVALAFSDLSDTERQWDHLQVINDSALPIIRRTVVANFAVIDRCETVLLTAKLDKRGRSVFAEEVDTDTDYALHFIVRHIDKLFRNRTIYQSGYDIDRNQVGYGGAEPQSREIVALPALSSAMEVRLIHLNRNKVIWSTLQDSTVLVAHDNRFVYNAEKYPGFTHPEIIRDHIAPILRQRQRRPSALRMLSVADRWFLSTPADDVATAEALLAGMIDNLMPEVDAQLPLYGTIASIVEGTDEKKNQRFRLDIGSQQGLVKKLRLDVFRDSKDAKKIGQVEIVSVDSSSSIARLHKLERSVRKRGESLAIGDLVFSRKRPPQFAKRNTP